MCLTEQRDFVDCMMVVHHAMNVRGAHQERMDDRLPRRREPRVQVVRGEFIHQEADGAAMHAVDRLSRTHVPVQRLQHQSVAAKRHHDIRLGRVAIAVKLDQRRQRLLGFRHGARDKGDPVISLGAAHCDCGLILGTAAERGARGRLYDLGCACRDRLARPSRSYAILRRDRRRTGHIRGC